MHGCKRMFLSVFSWSMFQVFYLDVAYICNGYTRVFWCFRYMLQVFQLFGCMLQVFHLNVTKVDLVLHMLQWDPLAVMHTRGKRRDGKRHDGERRNQRGMAAGAWAVPACVCSRGRARVVPSVTGGTR
jgi:hypothetical protein